MNAEAIRELLHRRPFEPFEVQLSSGEVHPVQHPDYAMLLQSRLVIGYPGTDRMVICSLLHITRLDTLQRA
ncbi:MAG: hypothetical protein HY721_13095 [Planctomycetes bacterium]|nr:hypothetical protein [Planctomycetota bacterium]